jgi:hypothetical protein
VSTEHQQSVNRASTERQQSVNRVSTEHHQSTNKFGCCNLYNPRAVLFYLPIIKVLATFRGNMVRVNVTTPENERQQSINRVSSEHQQSWVWHLVYSKGCATACTQNQHNGSRYEEKRLSHGHIPSLKISVNRVSTILGVASCMIHGLCYGIYP